MIDQLNLVTRPIGGNDFLITDDADNLSATGARLFLDLATLSIQRKGSFHVALAGGNTPKAIHRLIAAAPEAQTLPWHLIHFFWGDERCVPPTHDDSNYRMACDTLLDHIPVPIENVHRMPADAADLDDAAAAYQLTLANTFGVSPGSAPPMLDLVFLGMGPDCHTASLFPGTEALSETQRWVVANHVPKLDTWRMTFTAATINAAGLVVIITAGKDRAAPLADVIHGDRDPNRKPIQSITPQPGEKLWIIDQAAAEEL